MRVFRAHGLGNDYLVYEEGPSLTPALVRALCDRHEGVGSDGVLEPVPPADGAGFGLRIHNPDGSQAEKSGNGLRIYAWWRARGAPAAFSVWTPGGVVQCQVAGQRVRVEMGRARMLGTTVIAGLVCHRVDLGNPHAVVLGIPTNWEELGPTVENAVERRTNVQFAQVVAPNRVRVRVWERGAGVTRSSGSSACAVAAVGVSRGLLLSPTVVEMPGGELEVDVGRDGAVTLEGPVMPVGQVVLHPEWVRWHTRG